MVRFGTAPGSDDEYDWAYKIWWDTWFPEVLKECRDGMKHVHTCMHMYL